MSCRGRREVITYSVAVVMAGTLLVISLGLHDLLGSNVAAVIIGHVD